jgi:RNA polymerase sigma-70 factor (ECF subfamily)
MAEAAESEHELAARLQRGDAASIESLYDRYGRLAYSLAYRVLNDAASAEEIVQEAFLALWRNASSFDASRGTLRAWLLAIVRNRAIDRIRGNRGQQSTASIEHMGRMAEVPDAWETVSIELERKQVREAVAALPDEQRRTLELAYFGGLTHNEIARQMDVPLGTVKGRMRIGLEKVRSFLLARGVEA